MEAEEAELLSSFLVPMLHYYAENRATAAEMVKHPWLSGVVVQGELEMAAGVRSKRSGEPLSEGVTRVRGSSVQSARESSTGTARASPARKGETAEAALEEVVKLGPPVAGMVGMGRV